MATVKNEVSSIPSSAVQAKTTQKCTPSKATSQGKSETANSSPQQQKQKKTVKGQPGPLSTESHRNEKPAPCGIVKDDLCGINPATFLPFQNQDTILKSLQSRLEHAAFEFYQKKAPIFLEKRGWSCSEEGEWNEWLKYLLMPDNSGILPDFYLENGSLSIKGQDTLQKAFRIRHLAVHREQVSGREVINLARLANDILVAFDDAQGACMAQEYITISLQIIKTVEKSQEEIYTKQEAAARESRTALKSARSIIKARVEDSIQSELRNMSDIISGVEVKSLALPSSALRKQLPLIRGKVYQAVANAADQTGREVLMGRPWTLLFTISIALVLLISMAIYYML
ncbi:hypothetical protein V493_01781 [Pseudogymnoascus sp. VKM F-4281 (FW-2241)]|nr:hypothetical protein V493_01781 [Pseudogymnoascus sp. VKM F-4281 (FW-2241)]